MAGNATVTRQLRSRVRWRDDAGEINAVEVLASTVLLILLFLFLCQVVIAWHTRNILEQTAAEGARAAAAADGACSSATPAAAGRAERMGGGWVESMTVRCVGATAPGSTVTVTVTASTPMFGIGGSMRISASATAPKEG